MRIATVERNTKETQIKLTLNLDGTGKCNVTNPIGFFNHLLEAFCKHGLFDLEGSLSGDLEVDQHHLIEDTGIVLGQCFEKALGNCAGIYRSGCFYIQWTNLSAALPLILADDLILFAKLTLQGFRLYQSVKTEKNQVFRQTVLKTSGRVLRQMQNAIYILMFSVAEATITKWKVFSKHAHVQSVRQ